MHLPSINHSPTVRLWVALSIKYFVTNMSSRYVAFKNTEKREL